MFHRENEVLRGGTGIAVEGATIEVYVTGTDTAGDYTNATRATIYPTNVVGVAIANATLVSDAKGHYEYYAPNGVYDEVLTYGSEVDVDAYIQMFDMLSFENDAAASAEAAAASAVAAAASATAAATSATDAAASATAADTSADDAATSATAAGTARDGAVAAQLAAETAQNDASDSASNAAISETNAAASATDAAASLAAIAAMGFLVLKGATDCSANPNYPAAVKGDTYIVTVAGKIGGAAGTVVAVGDTYFATANNAGGTQAGVGASWDILVHQSVAAGGGLLAANNLSDVANALTALTNLGLSANAKSLVTAANYAAMKVLLAYGTIAAFDEATAAEIRAGTASKAVAADKLMAAAAPQTLTDAAPTAWDMSLGFNAKWTPGANRTLSTPTNPVVGQTYTLAVVQDGTGSRLVTWPGGFDWGTTGAPTLTTTANKVDVVTLQCSDAATPKFRAFLSGKGFAS